jgi:hypothetical protein
MKDESNGRLGKEVARQCFSDVKSDKCLCGKLRLG